MVYRQQDSGRKAAVLFIKVKPERYNYEQLAARNTYRQNQ